MPPEHYRLKFILPIACALVGGCGSDATQGSHSSGSTSSTTEIGSTTTTTSSSSSTPTTTADPTTGGTGQTGDASETGPAQTTASSSSADPGTSSTTTTDGETTGEHTTSGETSQTGGEVGPVVHPSCDVPFPDPPPPLPHINMTGDVPDFTLWEAFACDDPQVAGTPTCADNPDCVSDNCVEFLGDAGVCSYSDIDIWCDGEGGVMGTGDGSCWICLEPYEHARACCADPGVFDCRTWPFTDTPGIVGQVCATHTDCEPGLACSEPRWILEFHPTGPPCSDDDDCAMGVCNDLYHQCGEEVPHFAGYGICACPGTDSMEIVPGPACFE